jgi:hypothetical protein
VQSVLGSPAAFGHSCAIMSDHKLTIPKHRPLTDPAIYFVCLTGVSLALLVLSAVLNDSPLTVFQHPILWLAAQDSANALDTLANAAEVVAAVLAIAMTVVAIVVELAANRYSHEITRLFLKEPVNIIVLGLFVLTTVQCVWVAAVMGEPGPAAVIPQAGFALTLGLVTVCLLLLVPYIYFVFTFLSPISVIERISRDAYRMVIAVGAANISRHQARVEESVDQLQDVARSAIQQGDRGIAMAAVDALSGFVSDYSRVTKRLPAGWFDITQSVASDPDFVALAPESMEEVRAQGIWLERKVFRRFLSLVGQCTIHSRDVIYLIGINTRRIACEFGPGNGNLLELCCRSFNSYLRTTINARDPRSAYYLMNQYRYLAEHLLQSGREDMAVQIAGYLKEYGQSAHASGIPFLLEAAAYDVMQLAEKACLTGDPAFDALLDCLLDLDTEIKEESKQEESLLGVRRSQIQLAVLLLRQGDEQGVSRLVEDLRGERLPRLHRLRVGLETDERQQFWELTDRGVNFRYLEPELRGYLDELFRRIEKREPAP